MASSHTCMCSYILHWLLCLQTCQRVKLPTVLLKKSTEMGLEVTLGDKISSYARKHLVKTLSENNTLANQIMKITSHKNIKSNHQLQQLN